MHVVIRFSNEINLENAYFHRVIQSVYDLALQLIVQYNVEVYVRELIDKSLPSVFGRLRDV